MKKTFETEVLSGHKQHAAAVPFDPSREWNVQPQRLWRGRRGFPVRGKVNGVSFESAVVSRQKSFFLLIDDEIKRSAGLSEGDWIRITIEPG